MQASDVKAFRAAITALAVTFGKEATEELFDAYMFGLSDIGIEAIKSAAVAAIKQCEFMPKPVELRRLAGEQTHEQRAIAAWGDVLRAVPRGAYKHIDFGDPLINATVRNLGGWPTFVGRFTDEESEKWVRLEFLKAYQAFASSGVDGEACEPLPGLSQQTSVGGQLCAPVPLRIECSPDRLNLPCPLRSLAAPKDQQALTFKTI